MIVPVVISADLEAGSHVEPTSNANDLTTFEIPKSSKVLGPHVACIRANIGHQSTTTCSAGRCRTAWDLRGRRSLHCAGRCRTAWGLRRLRALPDLREQ